MGKPLLFTMGVNGLFYLHYTTHVNLHPSEGRRILVNAQGHKCHDRDSDPHSADQKYQILSTECPTVLKNPGENLETVRRNIDYLRFDPIRISKRRSMRMVKVWFQQ